MADRLDIREFRSSAKLPKDDEEQRRINAMVYQVNKDDDAPFDRKIDFWFAAIAWAAYHQLELPEDDSGGAPFVDIGIGQGGHLILLELWRIDLLNVLYLLNQPALLNDPFEPSGVDTVAGKFNERGIPVGGSEVIKNANRYALAGAMPMWEALIGGLDATKAPKQLAAAHEFLNLGRESDEKFRTVFGPGK